MLKRWRVDFDPSTKYFQFRNVWILLPGLSLQLWNEGVLTSIGNELGQFIYVDEGLLKGANRRLGRVLVELYVHARLLEALDIEWGGRVFGQRLYYLGLPFR